MTRRTMLKNLAAAMSAVVLAAAANNQKSAPSHNSEPQTSSGSKTMTQAA